MLTKSEPSELDRISEKIISEKKEQSRGIDIRIVPVDLPKPKET